MRTHMRLLLVAAFALAWQGPGCGGTTPTPTPPPAPPRPPSPEGGTTPPPQPSTPYGAACAHLEAIGCHQLPNCAFVMQTADAHHLTLVPLACMMAAQDRASALGCTFVRCQP